MKFAFPEFVICGNGIIVKLYFYRWQEDL